MRCATCGEDLREGAKFCPTCGTPTASGTAPVAQTVRIERNPTPESTAPSASSQLPPTPLSPTASTMASPPPPIAGAGQGAYQGAPAHGFTPPPAAPPRMSPAADETQQEMPTPRFQASTPPRPPFAPPSGMAGQGAPAAGLHASAGGGRSTDALGKASGADFGRLGNRLMRLLKLDTSVFGEVYRDKNATIPVAVFVAAVMVISAVGGYLFIDGTIGFDLYSGKGFRDLGLPGTQISRGGFGPSAGGFIMRSMIVGTLLTGAMLVAWAFITQLLLKQLGKVRADPIGLVRVLGLSLAPFVFGLLLFITDIARGLGWLVMGAVAALATVAVLESEDVKPGHAVVATLAGFFVFVIVLTFLGQSTRDWAPGFFAVG